MLRPNLRRTLKPTLNRFMGGGGSPVVNYVARLDGFSQYWQLSEDIVIPVNADFTLEAEGAFDYGEGSAWLAVIYGTGDSRVAFSKSGGAPSVIRPKFGGAQYDTDILWLAGVSRIITVSRVGGSVTFNYNGQNYTFDNDSAFTITSLGSLSGGGDFVAGYFKRLTVTIGGTLTSEINFTNKTQGATQLAAVGSVNATMINYTPDVWEFRNQPPQNTQQASFQQAKAGEESEVDGGDWSGSSPITYNYQWQLDGVDIVGATAKTLLVIAGMIGQSLRCVVTATNQYGSGISITAAIVVTI